MPIFKDENAAQQSLARFAATKDLSHLLPLQADLERWITRKGVPGCDSPAVLNDVLHELHKHVTANKPTVLGLVVDITKKRMADYHDERSKEQSVDSELGKLNRELRDSTGSEDKTRQKQREIEYQRRQVRRRSTDADGLPQPLLNEELDEENSRQVQGRFNHNAFARLAEEDERIKRRGALYHALRYLDADERSLIELRYLTDRATELPYENIGTILGVSTKTISRNLPEAEDRLIALTKWVYRTADDADLPIIAAHGAWQCVKLVHDLVCPPIISAPEKTKGRSRKIAGQATQRRGRKPAVDPFLNWDTKKSPIYDDNWPQKNEPQRPKQPKFLRFLSLSNGLYPADNAHQFTRAAGWFPIGLTFLYKSIVEEVVDKQAQRHKPVKRRYAKKKPKISKRAVKAILDELEKKATLPTRTKKRSFWIGAACFGESELDARYAILRGLHFEQSPTVTDADDCALATALSITPDEAATIRRQVAHGWFGRFKKELPAAHPAGSRLFEQLEEATARAQRIESLRASNAACLEKRRAQTQEQRIEAARRKEARRRRAMRKKLGLIYDNVFTGKPKTGGNVSKPKGAGLGPLIIGCSLKIEAETYPGVIAAQSGKFGKLKLPPTPYDPHQMDYWRKLYPSLPPSENTQEPVYRELPFGRMLDEPRTVPTVAVELPAGCRVDAAHSGIPSPKGRRRGAKRAIQYVRVRR